MRIRYEMRMRFDLEHQSGELSLSCFWQSDLAGEAALFKRRFTIRRHFERWKHKLHGIELIKLVVDGKSENFKPDLLVGDAKV